MARTITKAGMYCERCGPTVGEKDKHGLRNVASLAFTYGSTMKIEGWHCRNCGGPVATVSQHELSQAKEEQVAKKRQIEVERAEGSNSYAVIISALPQPDKKPSASANFRTFVAYRAQLKEQGRKVKLLEAEKQLADLPVTVDGLTRTEAERFADSLRGAGAVKFEVIPPADTDGESDASVLPAAMGTDSVLGQLEKLAELHKAGVLTDDEFNTKKADLLTRL